MLSVGARNKHVNSRRDPTRAGSAGHVGLLIDLQTVDEPVCVRIDGRVGRDVVRAASILDRAILVAAGLLPEVVQSGVRTAEVCVEDSDMVFEVRVNVAVSEYGRKSRQSPS